MRYTNILSKLLKRNTYRKNTVVILIGSFSTFIAACSTKGFVRVVSISKDDGEYIGKYRSFLNQFKGWQVVILIDTEDVQLENKSLSVIQSFLYSKNPVRTLINDEYSPLDIVAYNPYKIESGNTDIWHTNIIYSKLSREVDDIISFAYNSNFPLAGIYFLTLEIKDILVEILQDDRIFSKKNLVIFITTTVTSGIRIFALHNDMILMSKAVQVPKEASVEYIKGSLEKEVEDIISENHNYISDNKLVTKVVSVTNKEVAILLENQRVGVEWNSLSITAIKPAITYSNFSDEVLIYNLSGQYLAANTKLRKIFSLELFNNTFFKPTVIFTVGLLTFACYTHLRTMYSDRALNNLNNEYYHLSEEYRLARQKLHTVDNMEVIYDIISDFAVLKAKYQNPIKPIQNILASKEEGLDIISLKWKNISSNVGEIESEMSMNLKFTDHKASLSQVRDRIGKYKNILSNLLPKYNIEYLEDRNDIVNLDTKVMVPVTFTFKGTF